MARDRITDIVPLIRRCPLRLRSSAPLRLTDGSLSPSPPPVPLLSRARARRPRPPAAADHQPARSAKEYEVGLRVARRSAFSRRDPRPARRPRRRAGRGRAPPVINHCSYENRAGRQAGSPAEHQHATIAGVLRQINAAAASTGDAPVAPARNPEIPLCVRSSCSILLPEPRAAWHKRLRQSSAPTLKRSDAPGIAPASSASSLAGGICKLEEQDPRDRAAHA